MTIQQRHQQAALEPVHMLGRDGRNDGPRPSAQAESGRALTHVRGEAAPGLAMRQRYSASGNAISFGMGVVSGVIMPFQFGTNWSRFTDATADVLSPLMAYEGLMAFFLEASFLGVLLFGRRLVPRWAHFFAGLMVGFGTLMSSFWILSTNSWMQTPQGYKIVNDRFEPVDWLPIIFSPSFPYRLAHNVTAFLHHDRVRRARGRGLLTTGR